jgi:origin recognition complex subunit 4
MTKRKAPPGQDIAAIKQLLFGQLKGGIAPIGLDEQLKSIHQLVSQTVQSGESNSALITGPRGSGKSRVSLIDQCVELVLEKFQEVSIVRLNGLVHNTDRLALKAILRQLKMEDEENSIGNVVTLNCRFPLQIPLDGS